MACGILALNYELYLALKLAFDSRVLALALKGPGLGLGVDLGGPGLGLVLWILALTTTLM